MSQYWISPVITLLSFIFCLSANAETKVCVTADRAIIYKGQTDIATARKGTVLTVFRNEGNWIGISWEGNGIELSGWIAREDIDFVSHQIEAERDDTHSFKGKVVAIQDGDSIKIMRDGNIISIRLYGVICPKSGQPYASKARRLTSSMIFGKTVSVYIKSVDSFGWPIGEIIKEDGRNVAHELLSDGMAWWDRKYAPNDRELASLEAEAKRSKRGLWKNRFPMSPRR